MSFTTTISTKGQLITYVIRGVQLLFALLIFVLGCVSASKIHFSEAYPAMGIVSGIFSILYYGLLFLVPVLTFVTPAFALAGELFTFLWWLIAFACAADLFGDATCTYYFFSSDWKTGCQAGKAIIAFGVLGWLLSAVSLALLIFYSVIPAAKALAWLSRSYFLLGGIFPSSVPAAGAQTASDPEAAVGSRSVESAEETKTAADVEGEPYVADEGEPYVADASAPPKETTA